MVNESRSNGDDGEPRNSKLGVVIPLVNEEKTVENLLQEILIHLQTQDEIFCIVDTKSTDNTLDILNRISIEDCRVKTIWAPENTCVVDAYFRGYREALNSGCDWILEMDGGMSHLPKHIPDFEKAMFEGYDFAAGSRFVEGGEFKGNLFRYCLSRGGTMLTNLVLRTKMKDMTSGYECFTKKALAFVITNGVNSKGHFFQTEIRTMLHQYRWKEIPITYKCTSEGVPQSAIWESFSNLYKLLKARNKSDMLRSIDK